MKNQRLSSKDGDKQTKVQLIHKNEQNLKSTGKKVGRPPVDYKRVTLTYKLDPTELALLKKAEKRNGATGKRLLMKLLKSTEL